MANSRYRHKNYSQLLKELNSKSTTVNNKKSNTNNNNKNTAKDSNTVMVKPELMDISFDLNSLMSSINDIKNLINIYNTCNEMIEKEQQIQQDLLHAIEFCDDYKLRYKYSTQLHYCRQRRREYKNAVCALKPIVDFINGDEGKRCLNKLSNSLGESRKLMNQCTQLSYNPRVLTDLSDIINNSKDNVKNKK